MFMGIQPHSCELSYKSTRLAIDLRKLGGLAEMGKILIVPGSGAKEHVHENIKAAKINCLEKTRSQLRFPI